MSEIIICPSCQRRLRLPEECVGASVQCPGCSSLFVALLGNAQPPVAAPVRPQVNLDEFVQKERDPIPTPPTIDRRGPRQGRSARRARSGKKKAALLISGVVVVVAGLFLLVAWQVSGERGVRGPERRKNKVIFEVQRGDFVAPNVEKGPQQPLGPEAIAEELRPLFEKLGKAFRERDADGLVNTFDLERLTDELVAQQILPRQIMGNKPAFIEGMRQGLRKSLVERANQMEWKTFEIRRVKRVNGNDAEVLVRHESDAGILRMRWWLTHRQGAWRVFDMEDLDMGMRMSTAMASLFEGGMANAAGIAQAIVVLGDALQDLAQNKHAEAAEKKLQQVARIRLPGKLEGFRQMVTAQVRMHQGQNKEALQALEAAQRMNGDMPCLDLLKGYAFNNLGQWDKGLKHLQAYTALLGDDASVCREMGVALQGLNRSPEAASQFRKSLDYQPTQEDTFLHLLRSLSFGDNKDDIGARFAKLPNPHKNFDTCASDCREARDGEEVERLAIAMEAIDPTYAPAYFYHALAKAWSAKPEQAFPLLQKALAGTPDAGQRKEYTLAIWGALAGAGKGLEAYAAAPDPAEAFRYLAEQMTNTYRTDDLRALLARHEKKFPADPAIALFKAQVYSADGAYELADKAFSSVMANNPSQAALAPFRANRVAAKYYLGEAKVALKDIGPRRETFQQLANLCLADQDYALLQALLDEQEKADPTDPEVRSQRTLLKIKQNEFSEAVTLFKQNLARERGKETRKKIVDQFLYSMVDAGKALEGYRAAPDSDEAFQLLAGELLEQNYLTGLAGLLDAHRLRRPGNSWLSYYQGEMHLRAKAWDKAIQALQESRRTAPENLRGQVESNLVYAMYKAGRGREAYRAFPTNATFTQLASNMVMDKKGPELDALLAERRLVGRQPFADDEPEVIFYAARARLLGKQPAEATALFHKAYERQTVPDMRAQYIQTFVTEMAALDLGLEAYRSAPDKGVAFRALGNHFRWTKKEKELDALLNDYGPEHANDPWYRYFRAELHLLRSELEAADRDFSFAQAKAASQDEWTFRNALLGVRVRVGRTVQTYEQMGGGQILFQDLANSCVSQKNAGELAALIEAHRKKVPDFHLAPLWEMDLLWLQKDYQHLLEMLTGERQRLLAQPHFRARSQDYLVRCLIKLKRTKEAVLEAETIVGQRNGPPVLLVLAAAADGNVKKTIAVMDRHKRQSYLIEDCYRDPDLGPLLRSEPFLPFRQKYPEVIQKDGRDS